MTYQERILKSFGKILRRALQVQAIFSTSSFVVLSNTQIPMITLASGKHFVGVFLLFTLFICSACFG